jgi:hypothetical protein
MTIRFAALASACALSVSCHTPSLWPYGCDEPTGGDDRPYSDVVAAHPNVSCDNNVVVTQQLRCDDREGIVPDGPPSRDDCAARGHVCVDLGDGASCARGCHVNGDCPAGSYCANGLACAPGLALGDSCADDGPFPTCGLGLACLRPLDGSDSIGVPLDKATCCDTGSCSTDASGAHVVCGGTCLYPQ